MGTSFALRIASDGREWLLSLCGDLEELSVDKVNAVVDEIPHGSLVVLDVADVGFVDSSGVGCLLRTRAVIIGGGGEIILRRPSRAFRRAVEVTGLEDLFVIEDTPVGDT